MYDRHELSGNILMIVFVLIMFWMSYMTLKLVAAMPGHYFNELRVADQTDLDRDGIPDNIDDSDGDGIPDNMDAVPYKDGVDILLSRRVKLPDGGTGFGANK